MRLQNKRVIYAVLLLIIFCGGMYTSSAVNRDLHYNDELRYVEVAREMVTTGQWLVPHLGGEFYSDKPPVYFWVLNLMNFISDSYETLAVVLPSIISSIIITLMTFFIGKLFMRTKYSLLASLVLATSFLFFGLSIFVRMDMLMNVFIVGSLFAFLVGYKSEIQKKDKFYKLMFLFMGLATTIKGPPGFLVPLVVILGFLALERNFAELKQMKLMQGGGIFLAVVLLWIIPAVISGGKEYAHQLLIVQTFGRAVNSFAHQRPIYYFLTTFPLTFLPWSLFLISSFVYLLRNRKKLTTEIRFITAWFWMPFILFSLISGKLDIYLLPIYPAASLLAALLCKKVLEKEIDKKYLIIPSFFTALFFIIISFMIPKQLEGMALSRLLQPASIAMLGLGIIIIIISFTKKYRWVPYLVLLIVSIFWLNFSWGVVPPLSNSYTHKPLGHKIKEIKQEQNVDNVIAYEYGQPANLGVYTGFIIEGTKSKQKLLNYMQTNEKVLVVTKDKYWNEVENKLSDDFKKVYSADDYLLILK